MARGGETWEGGDMGGMEGETWEGGGGETWEGETLDGRGDMGGVTPAPFCGNPERKFYLRLGNIKFL